MESEQLHRAINGVRAFAASLPSEDQLRMTTVAEWDRMVDALEQADRTLDYMASYFEHTGHRPFQTSIGIARARIRRAR